MTSQIPQSSQAGPASARNAAPAAVPQPSSGSAAPVSNPLRAGLARHFTTAQLQRLASVPVGVAGAGGLGSNTAMLLARSGVERLLLVDDDVVEASNLNRQLYWPRHLGRPKVGALAELLRELNPAIRVEPLRLRLGPDTMAPLLRRCPLWVEALDTAETKALFVQRALLAGCRVASASGMAGLGGAPMHKRRLGDLVVVGDFQSDVADAPPLAPRVTQAAALLADAILEFILGPDTGGQRR